MQWQLSSACVCLRDVIVHATVDPCGSASAAAIYGDNPSIMWAPNAMTAVDIVSSMSIMRRQGHMLPILSITVALGAK